MRWWLLAAMLSLTGCPAFILSDINVGASAGTSFDDPFNWGKRVYQVSVSGHYTRDNSGGMSALSAKTRERIDREVK